MHPDCGLRHVSHKQIAAAATPRLFGSGRPVAPGRQSCGCHHGTDEWPSNVDNGAVSRRERGLLAEIENDALNDKIPLAPTLRKCITLGGAAKNLELRDWAAQELTGYLNSRDVPVLVHDGRQLDSTGDRQQWRSLTSSVAIGRAGTGPRSTCYLRSWKRPTCVCRYQRR